MNQFAEEYIARRQRLGFPLTVESRVKITRPQKPAPDIAPLVQVKPRRIIPVKLPAPPVDPVAAAIYMQTWRVIAREVAVKHGVPLASLSSIRRDRKSVAARHEAFWRCKQETSMSLPDIGRKFGGKDHTTVLHGIRKHEVRMALERVNEALRPDGQGKELLTSEAPHQ